MPEIESRAPLKHPASELGLQWQDEASCRGRGVKLFFRGLTAETEAVCGLCPVSGQCRDYAKQNREEFGIWGGLDFDQRAVRHRERLGRPSSYEASKVRVELAKEAIRLTLVDGVSDREASRQVGKAPGWFGDYKRSNPDEAGRIWAEVRRGLA